MRAKRSEVGENFELGHSGDIWHILARSATMACTARFGPISVGFTRFHPAGSLLRASFATDPRTHFGEFGQSGKVKKSFGGRRHVP
jgi:hypothetical protein